MPTVRVTYVCDHDRDRDLTINGFTPVYIRYLRQYVYAPSRGRVSPQRSQCVTSSTGRRFGCAHRPRAG